MQNFLERYFPLIGRILIGIIFLYAGIHKIEDPGRVANIIAKKGLPLSSFLAYLTILIEAGGGISLILGFYARIAGFFLILFLLPVTFLFHAGEPIQFLKNLAIIGGLFYIVGVGSGALSIKKEW